MAFNLADVLADVSSPDTGREQIQYIPLGQIDSDEHNFYQLSGVEDLAANIATVGLQQPIRVRANPDNPQRYLTVSGHRRRAALELLQADDPEKWTEVPCIVESDAVSPALQQLRLIYANANTRVMTSAEIGEQAAQVEKLLYQLKEEGYEFPGRMRDHVAEAVGASKTKLARLKVIRDNLIAEWMPLYKNNKIGETVAYALAGAPAEWQLIIHTAWGDKANRLYESAVKEFVARFAKIDKFHCARCSGDCLNKQSKMIHASRNPYGDPCTGCCLACYNLRNCSSCCSYALPEKQKMREAEKLANTEARQREAERIAPKLERIRGIYKRIGQARAAAGVSAAQFLEAVGGSYSAGAVLSQEQSEQNPEKISNEHAAIFGWRVYENDVSVLIKAADLLNVSLDWLLGREGYPTPTNVSSPDTWQTGNPPTGGVYAVVIYNKDSGATSVAEAKWVEDQWYIWGTTLEEDVFAVTHWAEFPRQTPSPLNHSCKTGISPSGHCGAAACCDSDVNCCLNCDDPCNARCGWIEDMEGLTNE